MKKIIAVLMFTIIIFIGILTGVSVSQKVSNTENINKTTEVLSNKATPTLSPDITTKLTPALPQRLTIPAINVNASIEQVGNDTQGRMDVPKTDFNVGWYSLGFKPGDKGNAVISGHLDQENGEPEVFWNLTKLKQGDKIIITDSENKYYTFSVTHTENYPYDSFPLNEVFGGSDQAGLNLITCEGTWDSEVKNYSHRTVVYSRLVQE